MSGDLSSVEGYIIWGRAKCPSCNGLPVEVTMHIREATTYRCRAGHVWYSRLIELEVRKPVYSTHGFGF